MKTLFRVGIFLLALQKLQVLRMTPNPNVLRWCHQHRRRWDRVSRSIYSASHVQFNPCLLQQRTGRAIRSVSLISRENGRKLLGKWRRKRHLRNCPDPWLLEGSEFDKNKKGTLVIWFSGITKLQFSANFIELLIIIEILN